MEMRSFLFKVAQSPSTSFCLNIFCSDCYRGNGKSYMGNLSKTRFGLICSTWDKNIEDLRRCVHTKHKEMVQ